MSLHRRVLGVKDMTTPAVFRAALRPLRLCSHTNSLLSSKLSVVQSLQQLRCQQSLRSFHTTRPVRGPTTLTNMLASDVPPPVQVSSVGPGGIKLVDGLVLTGPVVFLEGKVFLWDVPCVGNVEESAGSRPSSWEKWTRAHWDVFDVVVPKPEILIFGTGARMELVPASIRGYIKELGIQMDVMDTKNACSTYNLLAEEGRRVAAALLPIKPKKWTRKQG